MINVVEISSSFWLVGIGTQEWALTKCLFYCVTVGPLVPDMIRVTTATRGMIANDDEKMDSA